MKKIFLILALSLITTTQAAISFTQFYITKTGANTNSGWTSANTATYSSINGAWDGTSVFTPADGTTPASTISAGDFASIYNDAGATSQWTARITAVAAGVNGAITLSTTGSGAAPVLAVSGKSISVGGAWSGPTAASPTIDFPFDYVRGVMTNAAGNAVMVNVKGGTQADYFSSDGISITDTNGITWRGYTTTPGDLDTVNTGYVGIYGTNAAGCINLLLLNGAKNQVVKNFWFSTNFNSGTTTQHLVYCASASTENTFFNNKFSYGRLAGFGMAAQNTLIASEIWSNNIANSSTFGGVYSGAAGCQMWNNFAHDNWGCGFETDGSQGMEGCISVNNIGDGFRGTGDVQLTFKNCDASLNLGSGVNLSGAAGVITDPMALNFINTVFYGNTKAAITNSATTGFFTGLILNCAFGNNTQGDITSKLQGLSESGTVNLVASPYVNSTNFTQSATAATVAAGFNKWLYLNSAYTGMDGSRDIGAIQHAPTASSSGATSFSFPQ